MKRQLLSFLLVVLCGLTLCACGQSAGGTDSVHQDGTSQDAGAATQNAAPTGDAQQGTDSSQQTPAASTESSPLQFDVKYIQADSIDGLTPEYLPYVELKSDGTGVFFVNLMENAFPANVTYTIDGNTLTLKAASGVLDYFGSTQAEFTIDSAQQLTFVKGDTGDYVGATTGGNRFLTQ